MDQNPLDASLVHGVVVTPFRKGVSQPPFFTTRPQDAANLCIRGTYPEGTDLFYTIPWDLSIFTPQKAPRRDLTKQSRRGILNIDLGRAARRSAPLG